MDSPGARVTLATMSTEHVNLETGRMAVGADRFADDDDAIDYAGHSRYPHELHVLHGDRLVARFDPAVHEYL